MHPILAFARSKQTEIIQLIQEFVECESPSDNPAAVNRFVALMADRLAGMGRIRTFPGGRFGRHFRCEFDLPGPTRKSNDGIILALGHSDTVWPMGTLARMPFRREKGRLWGPGVLDLKSGLVFFIYAIRALREMNLPVRRRVVLQVNADEEVGSESSRPLTEEAGRRAATVLVLEPGTGLEGKLKTARKGVGDYTVTVQGRASHAGVDWEAGASAILELARQIDRIAGFTDLARGVTVNPGVIVGGTRTNVVAERASAGVDIRIARAKDEAALDRKFRSLKPIDARCTIHLEGGLNRPPMERSAGVRKLFATAQPLAAKLGVELQESSTGGGSDGNFTAAIGIPTLDGLGGVGEGAHASHESILLDRIADRTALLALLVSELGQ
jgi:glutamate carboxypeptidase